MPSTELAYPGLILGAYSGGAWDVAECKTALSCCAPSERMLRVPRPVTRFDALARQHELRHISRDGRDPNGTDRFKRDVHWVNFRKMIEELALESEALHLGQDIRQARDGLDWQSIVVPSEDYQIAQQWLQVAYSVPATGCDAIKAYWQSCHAVLGQPHQAVLLDAYKSLDADASWQNCNRWADVLVAAFPPPPPPPAPGLPQQENADARAERAEAEADARARAGRQANADKQASERGEQGTSRVPHGAVDVHNHLRIDRTGPTLAAQWRARDSGVVVRYPGRLYPDGRVFGERVRRASVLVDASSSMAWTEDDTRRLMRGIPGVWCGLYTVLVSEYGREQNGSARLCIVADKGRVAKGIESIVSSEREHGGVNAGTGCDLPALEYAIAHAPRPLVWLSDGGIGGDAGYQRTVDALLLRHRVPRIGTAKDVIDYLSGRAVPTFHGAGYTTQQTRVYKRRVGQW
jgi:hypothetical protein